MSYYFFSCPWIIILNSWCSSHIFLLFSFFKFFQFFLIKPIKKLLSAFLCYHRWLLIILRFHPSQCINFNISLLLIINHIFIEFFRWSFFMNFIQFFLTVKIIRARCFIFSIDLWGKSAFLIFLKLSLLILKLFLLLYLISLYFTLSIKSFEFEFKVFFYRWSLVFYLFSWRRDRHTLIGKFLNIW